ncbi:uncharacterized protein LOC125845765 [Solanum stenotomum]|uniref:uncharacterized protein LOC125845765 n=1 Tax=Solanum stenotomum TaxID=172797 RepID=UPI0020D125C3|nr:uncharacterized protein LOC125845765 [Solanum stenotomum]
MSNQTPENNMPEEDEESLRQSTIEELKIAKEMAASSSNSVKPLPIINPHFPQRLKKRNEDDKLKKFLSVFNTLSINLPLVEALFEMLGYAKFMKELDPGAFTIPCTIGMLQFSKALCNLGASINLMLYAVFKQLGLGEPKSTTIRLLMADRSIKHPIRILYDILVKVDRFIFQADFVILDCEIDVDVSIILGRLFLAIGKALVDVESGELKFRVNDEEVTFNVCKLMKQPSDIHVVSIIYVIDEVVASVSEMMCMDEPLAVVFANYDEDEVQGYDEVVAILSGLGGYSNNSIKVDIDLINRESPPAKQSTEEPPELELKALSSHLRYVFLGANNTLPVIIAADLLEWQVKLLVVVLKRYIKAIRWTIADIIGIPTRFALIKSNWIVNANQMLSIKEG